MWVEQKLCPVLGSYDLAEPHSVVIMDNATQHHSDRVCELIENTGARIIYLPPYSPDLNPIELMFGNYKMALKRHHNLDWLVAHHMSLLSVSPQNARNFFRKCLVPGCENCTDEEDETLLVLVILVIILFLNIN
jgi:hypothetical protein